jgi:putative flippase GtrA
MDKIVRLVDSLPFRNSRVARFLIAGGTSAVVNLSILFILTHWFGVWYLYSSIVAISIATIVSFILQKLWTFRNFGTEVHIQFPMHVTLALSNIVVNTISLYILVEWFGLWYLFAQVIVGAFLAVVNYTIYKTLIFVER